MKEIEITFKTFGIFALILWGSLSFSFLFLVQDLVASLTLSLSGLMSLVFAYLIYRFGLVPALIIGIFLTLELLLDVTINKQFSLIRILKFFVFVAVWLATFQLWKERKMNSKKNK